MRKCIFILSILLVYKMFPMPDGMEVINGIAEIKSTEKDSLTIKNIDKTIINWNTFSIASNEKVEFIQPNVNSSVLNRVLGKDLTNIMGRLESNGRVYLLNPNGILISKEGIVKTAGFFASTGNFLDEDFLKSDSLIVSNLADGDIINLGTIECLDGNVTLIGKKIINEGKISSNEKIQLASGYEVILKPNNLDNIFIRPKKTYDKYSIENKGKIEAKRVEIVANSSIYEASINHEGTIDALTFAEKDGKVFLIADDGNLLVSGNINAPSSEVKLIAKNINLVDEAKIDVSSDHQGGTILVGNFEKNLKGKKSENIYLGKDVILETSSKIDSDAGKVIIISDGNTSFLGSIYANGGEKKGDGGFIEISGLKSLVYEGTISTYAVNGKTGNLLLDPSNITISSNAPDPNVPFSTPYNPPPPGPEGTPCNVNVSDLNSALSSSNVTIQTSNGSLGTGYISIQDAITWSNDFNLYLIADDFIEITPAGSIDFSGEALLSLDAKSYILLSPGSSINSSKISSDIWDAIKLNAHGNIVSGSNFSGIDIQGNITSKSGNIILDGIGGTQSLNNGVLINASQVSATTGSISINGTSNVSDGAGVYINASQVSASTGSISINGTSSVSDGAGVYIKDTNTIQTRGAINVIGSGSNNGIVIDNSRIFDTFAGGDHDIILETTNGDIYLTGNLSQISKYGHPGGITLNAKRDLITDNTLGFRCDNNDVSNNNDILIEAGRNIEILSGAQSFIHRDGIGNIIFVTDNLYPTFPEIGDGSITINVNGLKVETFGGGEIRFYSARQSLNSIDNTNLLLNLATSFIPGPFGVDTNTEKWSIYYPNGSYGGPDYTFYYKEPIIIPPPPPPPPNLLTPVEYYNTITEALVDSGQVFYNWYLMGFLTKNIFQRYIGWDKKITQEELAQPLMLFDDTKIESVLGGKL